MTSKELAEMQNKGRNNMDRAALKDIREVKVDTSAPPIQRILQFMDEVNNPYLFRVGDSVVQVGWAETKNTLQDQMAELFRLQC